MKKILLTAVAMMAALSLYGQGNVNFANAGVGLNAPFFDVGGSTRLGAGTYTVELWAGPDANNLALAGAAYTGSFANGYFNAGQRTVSNVTGGTAVAVVRVWDNQGGTITSFAQASTTANVRFGSSATPFNISLTTAPATPATMTGLTSITLAVIPEPSTIALGILGAVGAFLLRRRK